MRKSHKLKLIDGTFTSSEAGKVLFDLISSKINYHAMQAFSIKERFGGDVSFSEKRIEDLKETRRRLEEIINRASEKGLNLKVESFIEITLIEEN